MHVITRWLDRTAQALISRGRYLRSAPNIEASCVLLVVGIVLTCQALDYLRRTEPAAVRAAWRNCLPCGASVELHEHGEE